MMRAALVTGGGRGIGRTPWGKALAIEVDVTDDASVAAGMRTLRDVSPRIDVLVNNAGVGGGEPIAGSDIARWRRTIDTSLTAIYVVTREAISLLPDGGRIVNLSGQTYNICGGQTMD